MSDTVPIKDPAAADPAACLRPGRFVDSDAEEVVAFAERAASGADDDAEAARRLYLAVRDGLRYDPYRLGAEPDDFRASRTLGRGYGFCVTKAAVLAAAARARGIPARLGFADVKNHLTSPRLLEAMGTDVFSYHGYTELYLGGRWVKATPAFNDSLCRKARIRPLEFDGEHDSIYHPFDLEGRRHMEYLRYRGVYLDIPLEEMAADWAKLYGADTVARWSRATDGDGGDFERDVTPSALEQTLE